MHASQPVTTCKHSIYRDFALIALAALGVGLAVSLTLATAIVLATPNRETTVSDARIVQSPTSPNRSHHHASIAPST